MNWITDYVRSSIGKKQIMAVSGLALIGFLFAHLAGNLTAFAGPDGINAYAVKLREFGALLWVARGGLLAAFLVHVWAGIAISAQHRAARSQRYRVFRTRKTTWYARMMLLSGIFLFAYIAYHLAHFTLGLVMPENAVLIDARGRHDVYRMLVLGFQSAPVAFMYIVAMFFLAMHIAHAVPSFFQTLGLNHPKYQSVLEASGPLVAVLFFVGYASIPAAVLAGILRIQS